MISRFEEIRSLLASDKRLVEVTVLFNGLNLKERFPELTREERAQLSRFARSRLVQIYEPAPTESDQGPVAAAEREHVVLTDQRPEGDVAVETAASESIPAVSPAPQINDLRTEELQEQAQLDTQSLAVVTAGQPSAEVAAPLSNNHDRWQLLGGVFIIVLLGLALIIWRAPWLGDILWDWVFGSIGVESTEIGDLPPASPKHPPADAGTGSQQDSNAPPLGDQTRPAESSGESARSAPPREGPAPLGSVEHNQARTGSETRLPDGSTVSSGGLAPEQPAQQQSSLPGGGDERLQAISGHPPMPTPSDIRQIQTLLDRLGYEPGPVDGILGPKTHSSIRKFQAEHGLSVDGEISVSLRQSLESAAAR